MLTRDKMKEFGENTAECVADLPGDPGKVLPVAPAHRNAESVPATKGFASELIRLLAGLARF